MYPDGLRRMGFTDSLKRECGQHAVCGAQIPRGTALLFESIDCEEELHHVLHVLLLPRRTPSPAAAQLVYCLESPTAGTMWGRHSMQNG